MAIWNPTPAERRYFEQFGDERPFYETRSSPLHDALMQAFTDKLAEARRAGVPLEVKNGDETIFIVDFWGNLKQVKKYGRHFLDDFPI